MKHLRTAREAALQILFQTEFQDQITPEEHFNVFIDNFTFENRTKDYTLHLVLGVKNQQEEINSQIQRYSENWKMERMALLDRILLQIAVFELCLSDQTSTAPKLCITDILDLAKKYSSPDSKNFINGVLDQIYNQELSKNS